VTEQERAAQWAQILIDSRERVDAIYRDAFETRRAAQLKAKQDRQEEAWTT
jgi:hypothetical protein